MPNPRRPDTRASYHIGSKRYENGAGSATGKPVDDDSKAVSPKDECPLHFDMLMRYLYKQGQAPESLHIIAADMVRLDEDGMDVEFTLLQKGTDTVMRYCVEVQHGKLVSINPC